MMKNTKSRKLRCQKKQPSQLKQITTKTVQISNILKMAESTISDEKALELFKQQFIAAYPRVIDKPDQKMMLEQLFMLWKDAEFEIRPLLMPLKTTDVRQFTILYKTYLNVVHEIGSILVKMGFTYCSQGNIPVEERKSANPKAVNEIQKNIDKLRKKVADSLPLPPGAETATTGEQ